MVLQQQLTNSMKQTNKRKKRIGSVSTLHVFLRTPYTRQRKKEIAIQEMCTKCRQTTRMPCMRSAHNAFMRNAFHERCTKCRQTTRNCLPRDVHKVPSDHENAIHERCTQCLQTMNDPAKDETLFRSPSLPALATNPRGEIAIDDGDTRPQASSASGQPVTNC